MTQPDTLLTAEEVATAARVSTETVLRWARLGTLASVTLPSGRRRFRQADVDALLSPQPTQ
jgi:excisionase family DNA binding protein